MFMQTYEVKKIDGILFAGVKMFRMWLKTVVMFLIKCLCALIIPHWKVLRC